MKQAARTSKNVNDTSLQNAIWLMSLTLYQWDSPWRISRKPTRRQKMISKLYSRSARLLERSWNNWIRIDVSTASQVLWNNLRLTTLCIVIVKASSGPRYVVSYRPTLPVAKLKAGTRVSLDMTTLTIMRILPREVDPLVYKMSLEDPGGASFAGIGGLGEQVRELREVWSRSCFANSHTWWNDCCRLSSCLC